jgi:hypothetical protein
MCGIITPVGLSPKLPTPRPNNFGTHFHKTWNERQAIHLCISGLLSSILIPILTIRSMFFCKFFLGHSDEQLGHDTYRIKLGALPSKAILIHDSQSSHHSRFHKLNTGSRTSRFIIKEGKISFG